MQSNKFVRASLFTILAVAAFILGWEAYWRNKGFKPTFNDDKILWATHRKDIYQSIDKATVFIGSSRIKFDLDIPTWEKLTGEKAIQLALVGTSPRLLLKDLADDEQFKGKVVVDVTEVLFFSQNPAFHKSALESIAYYKDQTPSEKLSAKVDYALEANLVFLEERRFSLSSLLSDLEIPNRPGVFAFPAFPKTFEWTHYNRQTFMSPQFLADTNQINWQTSIWKNLLMADPTPPTSGKALLSIFDEIKLDIAKIENRGGRVIFVRTPSSGPMAIGEQKAYPRNECWDVMLDYVHARGLHYTDDPQTAGLICPEWSHLSPAGAIVYTKSLVERLSGERWFSSPLSLL